MVPELKKRCGYTWWRDLTQEWVQCVHFEDGHATGVRPRHEYDNAFVVLGCEDDIRHYWKQEE